MNKPKPILDPDDEPVEWPDEVWDRAEIAVGGVVIREATGTLTKDFTEQKKSEE